MPFLLAALVGVVALVASCSSSGSNDKGGTVNITYWTTFTQDRINYLDSHFNSTHKDIHVKGQFLASSDQANAKVISALKSNTEPDVVLGEDPANLPLYAQSGKLVELTGKMDAETNALYPGIKNALFYKGKQLGFALGGTGNYLLFYNKKDFAAAGISAPPATWTELQADAKKLSDPSKNHYGFYVPLGSSEWISYAWEGVLWANGGEILNSDGKVGFNTPAGVQALTTWTDMVLKDKSAPTTSYAQGGSYDGAPAFASGAVSMIVEGQFALSEFSKIDYGVALMPAGTSGKSAANIGISVASVFDKGKKAQAASIEFLKWLGQPAQGAYLTSVSGGLPSSPDQLDQPLVKAQIAKQPTYTTFAQQLQYGHTRPTVPAYSAVSQALSDAISKALSGKVSPQQALDDAEKAGNKAISDAGN